MPRHRLIIKQKSKSTSRLGRAIYYLGVQQIFPEKSGVAAEAFADLRQSRGENWIYASAALTLNGKLGAQIKPYGGAGDWLWYNLMKDSADFIIIGGETIRKSGKKPDSRWQPGAAAIVVLSASGELPASSPLLQKQGRVIVYTEKTETESANRLLETRTGVWDAESVIKDLGPGRKMIDGGGQIYTMFSHLIQDWMLTHVPVFADQNRNDFWLSAQELSLHLSWLWQEDNRLFARYEKN